MMHAPVKGTSKTIQGSAVGKEGVGESRGDELAGVGRDVTTFVVAVMKGK